jgi:hypothetical protein
VSRVKLSSLRYARILCSLQSLALAHFQHSQIQIQIQIQINL